MSLLPPSSSVLERSIADALALNIDPSVLKTLWNPATCPANLLPWLAWTLSVDGWELAESEEARRDLLMGAVAIHKQKGTPSAIRNMIRRLGFGEVDLIEGINRLRYDGQRTCNGLMIAGDPTQWATYRVVMLERPLTNDQVEQLKTALAAVAPARCRLASIEYQSVPLRCNGVAIYNGAYNNGSSK